MMYPTIYCYSNFGTWNCWNANLGNGLYMCCIILYMQIEILELGTVGTQIKVMVFIWCILPYIDAQILELGTSGTQI